MHIDPPGVIRLLNLWVAMDSEAMSTLFNVRTDISPELSDQSRIESVLRQSAVTECSKCGSVVIGAMKCKEGGECEGITIPEFRTMDVLSMINGFFGGRRISVVRSEHGRIIRFEARIP